MSTTCCRSNQALLFQRLWVFLFNDHSGAHFKRYLFMTITFERTCRLQISHYIISWFSNIKVYTISVWCELVWHTENEILFKRRPNNPNVWIFTKETYVEKRYRRFSPYYCQPLWRNINDSLISVSFVPKDISVLNCHLKAFYLGFENT